MVHRRSESAKIRREQRRLTIREAYWDRNKGEAVALRDAAIIHVVSGEVLYDVRGFVSPALEEKPRSEM